MACCLKALTHYLDQRSLIISEVFWYSHENKSTGNTHGINLFDTFESYILILLMNPINILSRHALVID